jgi:hypothetical protein
VASQENISFITLTMMERSAKTKRESNYSTVANHLKICEALTSEDLYFVSNCNANSTELHTG